MKFTVSKDLISIIPQTLPTVTLGSELLTLNIQTKFMTNSQFK